MRFRLASSLLVVPAAAVLFAACGSSPPPPARGAYSVSFKKNGMDCIVESHNGAAGEVAANSKNALVVNGVDDAEVECSVKGGGTFAVDASIYLNGNYLAISVPSIKAGAT